MNVYDFDGTIYSGDSSKDFYFFILKRYPRILKYLFDQVEGIWGYFLSRVDKTCAKEHFFSFLKGVPDIDVCLEEFWNANEHKITKWYRENQQEDDVIISASPDFLLMPICKRLGIKKLIASKVNIHTGKFESPNCYGEEKKKRFLEEYPDSIIDSFYSDSTSDVPLKKLSKNGFLVKKDTISEWIENQPTNQFISIQFLRFIAIGVMNAFNGILFAYLFSLFIQENLGFICGYMVSLTISYLLNSLITFKEQLTIKKYVKFCVGYIPNFVLQNMIVFIFMNLLKWPSIIVYIMAVGISVPITYIVVSYFAFGRKVSN